MTCELHPEAEAEFREATGWYAGRSLTAGEGFVAAIESAIAIVLRDPGRFEPAGNRCPHYSSKAFSV